MPAQAGTTQATPILTAVAHDTGIRHGFLGFSGLDPATRERKTGHYVITQDDRPGENPQNPETRRSTTTTANAVIGSAACLLSLVSAIPWLGSRVHAVGLVTGPDGKVKPQPPSPGIAYARLTARPEVAEALTILATPAAGWVELYKVYEIIRAAVKPIALDKSGLATKDEISAFTCSANRPDVGGPAARHARIDGSLPKRTMTELQAREFIGRLLRAWMDALV